LPDLFVIFKKIFYYFPYLPVCISQQILLSWDKWCNSERTNAHW